MILFSCDSVPLIAVQVPVLPLHGTRPEVNCEWTACCYHNKLLYSCLVGHPAFTFQKAECLSSQSMSASGRSSRPARRALPDPHAWLWSWVRPSQFAGVRIAPRPLLGTQPCGLPRRGLAGKLLSSTNHDGKEGMSFTLASLSSHSGQIWS